MSSDESRPQGSEGGSGAGVPRAVVRTRSWPSTVWLIPLVAAFMGIYLAWWAWSEQGPTITIVFHSAEGLEAEVPTEDVLTAVLRRLPTGATEEWSAMSETLGERVFDDGFDEVPPGAVFALSGGDRRIEVVFNHGYPAVQIFAPKNDDVVGIEPMAAPTNALRKGGYSTAVPGRPASASFSIRLR